MTKQRAEIGFTNALEDLEPTDWQPAAKDKPAKARPPREEIRKVAQATGFKSREAAPAPAPSEQATSRPAREGRIYRTGRSEQLNLKVRAEDRAAFHQICDNNHWVQGYTFQRAIEALEREIQNATATTQPMSKSA